MNPNARDRDDEGATLQDQASASFVQRLHGEWTPADQTALEARLECDPAFADAYRRVEESWHILDTVAETPEVIARREQALVYARRANSRRWLTNRPFGWRSVAVAAGLVASIVTAWLLLPHGYRPGLYQTGIGEQRLVDLSDRSRLVLDAKTRLRVRYSEDARVVQLEEGQAQFYVAKDPARPFKVLAGGSTVVAVGTVFTVEYAERRVRVSMLEGRVAVYAQTPASTARVRESAATSRDADSESSVELGVGEELRLTGDGRMTVAQADIESATAWRKGKVVFRGERLDDAVHRLNRYSRLQIEIPDEELASRTISGVFETGDSRGFVSAVVQYYPVTAEYVDVDSVQLRSKSEK